MGEGIACCHSADARWGLRSCDLAPLFGQVNSGWLVVESASSPPKAGGSRLPRHSAWRLLTLSDRCDYFVAVGQVLNGMIFRFRITDCASDDDLRAPVERQGAFLAIGP